MQGVAKKEVAGEQQEEGDAVLERPKGAALASELAKSAARSANTSYFIHVVITCIAAGSAASCRPLLIFIYMYVFYIHKTCVPTQCKEEPCVLCRQAYEAWQARNRLPDETDEDLLKPVPPPLDFDIDQPELLDEDQAEILAMSEVC